MVHKETVIFTVSFGLPRYQQRWSLNRQAKLAIRGNQPGAYRARGAYPAEVRRATRLPRRSPQGEAPAAPKPEGRRRVEDSNLEPVS
jgi:hypothetical protein